MTAESLVPTRTGSDAGGLQRREERRWSGFGAALGAAATSGIAVAVAMLAGGHGEVWTGLLGAAAVTGPAALLGARFGQRWRRRVERDAETVSVKRWLGRLAGDGAVFAGASAASTAGLLVATSAGYFGLGGILQVIGASALVAAPAGALTVAAVGLPLFVSLGRGQRPWAALLLAALLGPAALAGTLSGIAFFASMFG